MMPIDIKAYFEAKRLQIEEKNLFCYLQGVYFHDAVAVNFHNALCKGKKAEYHKEPIRLTPITEREKEEQAEKEKQQVIACLNSIKKDFDKKEATG